MDLRKKLEQLKKAVAEKQAPPQAIQQPTPPPVVTEDADQRLKPALQVIREMLQRAEQKRIEDEKSKQAEEHVKLAQQNAEVVQPMTGQIYVSIDGDNIGNAVARAEKHNDEQKLADVSRRINFGQQVLTDWAHRMGGKVIEAGGDEGLVKVPGAARNYIEQLRIEYKKMVGATCTIGVGKTISESTQARMLGKLRGKNTTVVFDDGTEKELELRMQQRGPETPETKLKEAGLAPGAGPEQPQEQPKASEQELPPAREIEEPRVEGKRKRKEGKELKEAPPQEEPPKQEQAPAEPEGPPPFSKELIEASAKEPPVKPKPKSVLGNYGKDPEIEAEDFSDRDSPEFAKRLWYAMKYGRQ